jgi:hypothetical protein
MVFFGDCFWCKQLAALFAFSCCLEPISQTLETASSDLVSDFLMEGHLMGNSGRHSGQHKTP